MSLAMFPGEKARKAINALLVVLGVAPKSKVVNKHVTCVFSPAWQHCSFAGLQAKATVTRVLHNHSHVVVELGEIKVESWPGVWQDLRPAMDLISDVTGKGRKNQRYHITHSLSEGAKAKDSNLLLSGEVECTRLGFAGEPIEVCGELRWIANSGGSFVGLDNLKKCPDPTQVGLARTVFSGVGSHHAGDGGGDFLGCFGHSISEGASKMSVAFGREGCGIWRVTPETAETLKVGVVRPGSREVSWAAHRDDLFPTVAAELVTEEVSPETSCVITYSLPQMLLDPDDDCGEEKARAEKARMILENKWLWIISIQANGAEAPKGAQPPSPHRCRRKSENGEPLPEGELERSLQYWFSEENPEGWVLVKH
tara:strand:+ start:1603 stop:2706 length:1104 start_codon:yes stop_codon:yes gene_type:complete